MCPESPLLHLRSSPLLPRIPSCISHLASHLLAPLCLTLHTQPSIMATHVVTATPGANQISVYGHPSPTNSSTTTPSNNSPTSPRLTSATLHQLPLQSRQLRPPKGPLYVPAALRPTERPQKSSPITPPRSVHGSLDSLEEAEPISRRSTMESKSSGISKSAEHEWMKNESLGDVTGHPTRDHWKVSSTMQPCLMAVPLYIIPVAGWRMRCPKCRVRARHGWRARTPHTSYTTSHHTHT